MFSAGLEKIAVSLMNKAMVYGRNAAKGAQKWAATDAGKAALKTTGVTAMGGAAAGAVTNKDENGNSAPIAGAIKGGLAGGAVGAGGHFAKGLLGQKK